METSSAGRQLFFASIAASDRDNAIALVVDIAHCIPKADCRLPIALLGALLTVFPKKSDQL